MTDPVLVTKPFLPPLEEVLPELEQIWATGNLTNNGELHSKLERALAEYLNVPCVSLFCNATTALMAAQKALNLTGDFITTPYSFVATTHAFSWTGMRPIFVDVRRDCMTIDPSKIESAITPKTTAIVPVHCYGNTCDIEAIKHIADKHDLKIIYDACHSFGIDDGDGSALRHGDFSVVSFHATKVFNTFEGGMVVSPSAEQKKRVDLLKNFGFVDETTVDAIGINGKMSEFNAAVGLAQLNHFARITALRGEREKLYRDRLEPLAGLSLFEPVRQSERNYCYFPVLVGPEFPVTRDQLHDHLRDHNIFARRYFYPLISEFPMYADLDSSTADNLPVATQLSRSVLCLPMHPSLSQDQVHAVCDLIISCSE